MDDKKTRKLRREQYKAYIGGQSSVIPEPGPLRKSGDDEESERFVCRPVDIKPLMNSEKKVLNKLASLRLQCKAIELSNCRTEISFKKQNRILIAVLVVGIVDMAMLSCLFYESFIKGLEWVG